MIKKLLFAIIFLQSTFIFSQNDSIIQLSGMVVNDTLEPLPFTNIIIISKSQGTISNFYGFFSFAIDKSDTILFSSVGYKPILISFADSLYEENYYVDIKMDMDTIFLRQIDVFPWPTFQQFKHAFVTLKIPDDDLERARKNIELINIQKYAENMGYDAGLSYKNYMNQYYQALYTKGQYPINNLINPLSWAAFIKAIKEGDFKKKEN